jgi:hypothetical protein
MRKKNNVRFLSHPSSFITFNAGADAGLVFREARRL